MYKNGLLVTLFVALLVGFSAGSGVSASEVEDGPAERQGSTVPAEPGTDVCHNLCERVIKYVQGGIGDVDVLCHGEGLTGYCIGGAIFTGVSGGRPYQILIYDNFLSPVGGAYQINGGGLTGFCGSVTTGTVPSGATIEVRVDGPLGAPVSPCGGATMGVEGEIGILRL